MNQKTNNIVIVGGGSAGWMTAASLISLFPDKKITVIESKNVPTVGVGESTIGGIRNWMYMIGIDDADFMKETDATYKLAIEFKDFYKKNNQSWFYPFGRPFFEENLHNTNDWFIKKALYPETTPDDFADCFYPQMALVKENKLSELNHNYFDLYYDTAFHFDATKFGIWLRDKFCKPRGVIHEINDVVNAKISEIGISKLTLNDKSITADLFVDCTGFQSLLLEKYLKVPFKSYEHILPNNRAWATRIPYIDKENQINSVTKCTAIDHGWVWNIPLWSRIGSGYVYSDKFVSNENALIEFKQYLKNLNHNPEQFEYKNISMRVGIQEKLWEKNVVAIGLSAAFIEPLESTGLVTVHEFVTNLCRTLSRDEIITQWDRDEFNLLCHDSFNYYTQFVSMHYALSKRDDTEYWRDISKKSFYNCFPNLNHLHTAGLYQKSISNKGYDWAMSDDRGMFCLAAGMNWNPIDLPLLLRGFPPNVDRKKHFEKTLTILEKRKQIWKEAVKTAPSTYRFLLEKYYKD